MDRNTASFRDPAGFVFAHDDKIFRFVAEQYRRNYDLLIASGLCEELQKSGLLINHKEAKVNTNGCKPYKVLEPEKVPFISYPHEWCFSQFKDAALCTLEIAERSLHHGMILKDASAYNVQFLRGQAVFIDTLSFEEYEEGTPWIAYKQFCQHFLAPLALMALTDISLNKLAAVHIDGIPLDLASRLLPFSSKFKLGLGIHIHLHAKSQSKFSDKKKVTGSISKNSVFALFDSLKTTIKKLKWEPAGSEWGEYYTFTNYTDEAMKAKEILVGDLLKTISPKTVWDLGANEGNFSRIASQYSEFVLSADIDPIAVEKNFHQVRKSKESILPIRLDLTNPSTNFGWAGSERVSLEQRGPADCVMALALVHHLAISNNVPFKDISEYLSSLCRFLIIEFVPKSDSQVQKLLKTRKDIFVDYDESSFLSDFSKNFTLSNRTKIINSDRTLYLFEKTD